MNNKIKLLILFAMLALPSTHILAEEARLLFKSSFDNDITINTRPSKMHEIRGTDNTSGYSWPGDLPGNGESNYFNYVIGNYDNYLSYVDTKIEPVTVPNSYATKALYIEYKRDDSGFVSTSRNQYVMFGNDSSNDPVQRLNKGYIKYKIKKHFNKSGATWDLPLEWKDMNDDGFRLGLYIYGTNTSTPYWVAKGQYMINGGLGDNVWQNENRSIPVPEDEWFDLEVYWYGHSNSSTGKFKVAINGQIVFDITNQTKDPSQPTKMFYFMPFKIYGAVGHAWITDVEMWEEPPSTSILSGGDYTPAVPEPTPLPEPTPEPVIPGPWIMDPNNNELK